MCAMVAATTPALRAAQTPKIDAKRACLLARDARHADDDFAATLAAYGHEVADCLILEIDGNEPDAQRAEAASALVQALATARPSFDAATSQHARAAIVKALRDRSVGVRVATVTALADFGDESMIPALLSVARADPVLSFRDYTARAITTMRKRLADREPALPLP